MGPGGPYQILGMPSIGSVHDTWIGLFTHVVLLVASNVEEHEFMSHSPLGWSLPSY